MIAAMFPGESAAFGTAQGRHGAWLRDRFPDFDAAHGGGQRCARHTQMYGDSVALWDSVSPKIRFSMLVGHSLGFYAALYAAGALGMEEGKEVISRAHAAILEVSSGVGGGMSAVIGLRSSLIGEICGRIHGVYVANINAGNQVVISGTADGLAAAEEAALVEGAFLVRRLAVNAPLHSPLMGGIEDLMDDALRGISIGKPVIPLVNHVSPGLLESAEQIREVLRSQLTAKVLWRDAVLFMVESGATTFVELGTSDVLSRIVKWIRRDLVVCSPDEVAVMEAVPGHAPHADGFECGGGLDVQA